MKLTFKGIKIFLLSILCIVLFFVFIFVACGVITFYYPRFFDTAYERAFENNLIGAINRGETEMLLKDITPFDWETVCIVDFYYSYPSDKDMEVIESYLGGFPNMNVSPLEFLLSLDENRFLYFKTLDGRVEKLTVYWNRFLAVQEDTRASWYYKWKLGKKVSIESIQFYNNEYYECLKREDNPVIQVK